MADVYISHFGENSQNIADSILNKLNKDGISCFSTPSEETDTSENALMSCKVFVIILNQAASYSKQVLDEISTACVRMNGSENITILPFQISDETISDEAMSYIGRLHWTEAFDGDIDKHIEDIIIKIKDAIKNGRSFKAEAFTIRPEQKNLYTADPAQEKVGRKSLLAVILPLALIIIAVIGAFYVIKSKKEPVTDNGSGIRYTLSTDSGAMTWTEDGNTYTGTISNGVLEGEGKAEYSNGSIYEGNFVSGAADGKGKCTFPNGNIYEGEWSNGKMSGYGKFYFAASGSVYEGMWENGLRNGAGKFVKSDGEIWEGTWKDDLEEGDFTITYADGTVEKYVFSAGNGKLIE